MGDTIRVQLTFRETVTVTGTPRLKIDFSSEAGDERWADYSGGSGTKTLEFSYTVAAGDVSSAGVAVLANTLEVNGGTIGSGRPHLLHPGLDHDPNHRVTGGATPPRLVRGEIDGGTMTLYFSEPLDPDSGGGYFWVSMVSSSGGRITFGVDAGDDVEISGNAVTAGLRAFGGPVRARAGVSDNSVMYVFDPTLASLRDLDGNPVSTSIESSGELLTRLVYLDNLTGVAPSVTGVAVSSEAGDDDTYGLGEKIRVRLTFSKTVNVTGTPRLKLDFSTGAGDERWAAFYASGSGTKALEFAYTVAAPDVSAGGVSVLANTLALNGGTIESALTVGESAALGHAGLGTRHEPQGERAGGQRRGCREQRAARAERGRRTCGADRGGGGLEPGLGRHLHAGRENPCPGELRRGGFGDRQSRPRDRHGPGGMGREAGGL